MNLEYAAYLLNESHILSEDANSSGIDKTKKWVKKNYHLTELGQEAVVEVVVVRPQREVGVVDDQGHRRQSQVCLPVGGEILGFLSRDGPADGGCQSQHSQRFCKRFHR